MKLSEIQGERALDVLADLIEPASKILGDKEAAKCYKESKIKFIKMAIKNHKREVIEILAVLDGVPVDEYKVNLFTLPMKLMEIINDPELQQLFSLQGQMGDAKSSGSVLESDQK